MCRGEDWKKGDRLEVILIRWRFDADSLQVLLSPVKLLRRKPSNTYVLCSLAENGDGGSNSRRFPPINPLDFTLRPPRGMMSTAVKYCALPSRSHRFCVSERGFGEVQPTTFVYTRTLPSFC